MMKLKKIVIPALLFLVAMALFAGIQVVMCNYAHELLDSAGEVKVQLVPKGSKTVVAYPSMNEINLDVLRGYPWLEVDNGESNIPAVNELIEQEGIMAIHNLTKETMPIFRFLPGKSDVSYVNIFLPAGDAVYFGRSMYDWGSRGYHVFTRRGMYRMFGRGGCYVYADYQSALESELQAWNESHSSEVSMDGLRVMDSGDEQTLEGVVISVPFYCRSRYGSSEQKFLEACLGHSASRSYDDLDTIVSTMAARLWLAIVVTVALVIACGMLVKTYYPRMRKYVKLQLQAE